MTPVRLEPGAPMYRVKHSTTALPEVVRCFFRKIIIYQGSRGGPTYSGGGGGSNFFQAGGGPNANFHRYLSKLGFSRQGVGLSPSGSAHVLPSLAAWQDVSMVSKCHNHKPQINQCSFLIVGWGKTVPAHFSPSINFQPFYLSVSLLV